MTSASPQPQWGPQPGPQPPVQSPVQPPIRPVPSDAPLPPRLSVRRRSPLDPIRALPVAIGGLVLVAGGAVVQTIAIMRSPWVRASSGTTEITYRFSDFAARTQRGWAYAYFSYAAWVMLGVVAAMGLAACVRWRGARAFRYLGAIIAVLAAFATVAAVLVFAHQTDDPVFKVAGNYAVGPYLAVIGLIVGALGAAAGGTGRFRSLAGS